MYSSVERALNLNREMQRVKVFQLDIFKSSEQFPGFLFAMPFWQSVICGCGVWGWD